MSHDTHDTHGHHHHFPENDKPVIAFKSAFYFVLIIAGLFVAAMGFVKSMGHDESGHGGGHATHQEAGGHEGQAAHGAHEMKDGSLEGAEHTNPAQEEHHEGEGGHETSAPAEHH